MQVLQMSIFLPNLIQSISSVSHSWWATPLVRRKSLWKKNHLEFLGLWLRSFLFKSPIRSDRDSTKICIYMIKWQIRYKETGKAFNHLMKGNNKREAAQNNPINKDKFTPESLMDLTFCIFILSLTKGFFLLSAFLKVEKPWLPYCNFLFHRLQKH